MTNLFENFPLAEAAVNDLPGQIVELANEAAEYKKAVRDYLDFVENRHAGAVTVLEQLVAALQSLKRKAEGEKPALEKAVSEVVTAAQGMLETLTRERDELKTGVEGAGTVMGELKDKLEQAGERAQAAQSQATEKCDAVETELTSSAQEIDAGVSAVASAADEVEAEIAKASTAMVKAMDTVGEKLDDFTGFVQSRLDDHQGRLDGLMDSLASETGEALDGLSPKLQEIKDGLSERAGEERRTVDGAMDEVADSLASMGGVVSTSDEALPGMREEVAGQQELLDASLLAMKQTIGKVDEAARHVSLDVDWAAMAD